MVITFQDASHPDITVVVDRNEARRIREGGLVNRIMMFIYAHYISLKNDH